MNVFRIPLRTKPLTRSATQLFQLPSQLRTLAVSACLPSESVQSDLDAQTISNGFTPMSPKSSKERKAPSVPRASASVLLVSPQNHILLLQRVKQSSSFPSAHVFPGGNVSAFHDGKVPDGGAERHLDSEVYRMAAVRETFEESGILIAKSRDGKRLVEVPEAEREEGRRLVHGSKVRFLEWLEKHGGTPDLDGLVPFTRWVTPTNVAKRFSAQMYLYFLPTLASTPLSSAEQSEKSTGADAEELEPEIKIPVPTTDGGLEHTTARFLPASAWLRLAQEGRIIMFPPQFFLLHQVAQHFDSLSTPTAYSSISRDPASREDLEARRKRLLEFVRSGSPPWTDMCISPTILPLRDGKRRDDGRVVLGLNRPGPELESANSGRSGVKDQCVLVEFKKDGPRRLAVIDREEAVGTSAKL